LPGLEVFLPVQCTSLDMQRHLDESNVFEYLRSIRCLGPDEAASLEPAGDGNINWVRRIRTRGGTRSFVLKQARAALERFPEYQVSTERLIFEARYFELTAAWDPERVRPEILHLDPEQRVLVLEDLGDAERLDAALARGAPAGAPLRRLAGFLGRVHAQTRDPALAEHLRNGEMQRLHGDHIFALPYRPNEFPLSPALARCAREVWSDNELRERIDAAFARYLEPHGALVHADAQAGNILLAERGAVLLDAEIAHVGDPAFDVGVLLAHVMLPAIARGEVESARASVRETWDAYVAAHGVSGLPRYAEVARYAGIEMLRRTIGAARIPAVTQDEAGLAVAREAIGWVRNPPAAPH
jgi:5-methylthioribose kinase